MFGDQVDENFVNYMALLFVMATQRWEGMPAAILEVNQLIEQAGAGQEADPEMQQLLLDFLQRVQLLRNLMLQEEVEVPEEEEELPEEGDEGEEHPAGPDNVALVLAAAERELAEQEEDPYLAGLAPDLEEID